MNAGNTAEPWLRMAADCAEWLGLRIGRAVAWLTLLMVLITVVVVVLRYWLQTGAIRLQESITFMHAAVFMLGAAWTLAAGEHVRVDIFYSRLSARGQAWVNLAGTLLLLMPFAGFLLYSSQSYVQIAWQIRESSQEAGGLPFPFPALMKSFIPAAAFLLLLQGVAMLLRAAAVLTAPEKAAD